MRVIVPEPALRDLLTSEARLRGRWPDDHLDVMTLIQVLRASGETLADAIATGLIAVEAQRGGAVLGGVSLTHRRAKLSGIARGKGDVPTIDPPSHAARVTSIAVLEVAVAAERRVG